MKAGKVMKIQCLLTILFWVVKGYQFSW